MIRILAWLNARLGRLNRRLEERNAAKALHVRAQHENLRQRRQQREAIRRADELQRRRIELIREETDRPNKLFDDDTWSELEDPPQPSP